MIDEHRLQSWELAHPHVGFVQELIAEVRRLTAVEAELRDLLAVKDGAIHSLAGRCAAQSDTLFRLAEKVRVGSP